MSKKLKCPSCDMAGNPEGDDYKQVTTYRGRPVLQCFWCDSHVMIRRTGGAMVLDLNHKAIRHLRSDLDHEEMVSLLLDQEEDQGFAGEAPAAVIPPPSQAPEELAAAVETEEAPAAEQLVAATEADVPAPAITPRRKKARKTAVRPTVRLAELKPVELEPAMVVSEEPAEPADFEPAMFVEAPVVDNTPVVVNPERDRHNTPVGTTAELVSSIPVTARALDHDSLMHIASRVGWNYTPVRKQPEWMNFELPPPKQMGPLRTKLQGTINMMKYFRINAGTKEQRRMETIARRARLVEYRRRMFNDRLEALNAMQAIEYKPKAI